MLMTETLNADCQAMSLHEFTEKSYRDYAMYVILDRALPHISDGLKPVQRRIVYAMSELGLSHVAKFKKSARTVGDVLGKYHPHGDSACYEAMVLMAQGFSYRYPLVQGQGNWGSIDDPKSFAAMRYTESRLSAYAKLLLAELPLGTVDWQSNFDGTLKEPVQMPAQVPNVLLNGGMGIAVGMATDIPPHNLKETLNALLHLLKRPNASLAKILDYMPGPDYPGGGEVVNPADDLYKLYEKGQGTLRLRARYQVEPNQVILHELPYQVASSKVLQQIAKQMQAKKLPWLTDIQDESDHENPVRIVLTLRSNRVDVGRVMDHLFASTDLERTVRGNFNMIGLDGRPQVKPLLAVLSEWLSSRLSTVRRRLEFELGVVEDRLHILAGLLVAYLNLDEVIRIIRQEDDPKAELIKAFGLTEIQADAILDTKLRHLAKLEEFKIRAEQSDLIEKQKALHELLSSDEALRGLLASELKVIQKNHGDERRTHLVERKEAIAMREEDLNPVEPITLILSKLGWIRCAKGSNIDGESMAYKTGDGYYQAISGRSNQTAVFVDTTGRSYAILASKLPGARGSGEPLSGHFQITPGAGICQSLLGKNESRWLIGSNMGYGFICQYDSMISKNKAGKAHLTLPKGACVLPPLCVPEHPEARVFMVSKEGRAAFIALDQLPQLPKGKGVKLISIDNKDFVSGIDALKYWVIVTPEDDMRLYVGRKFKHFSYNDCMEFAAERARRGNKLHRAYRNVTALKVVKPGDE